MLRNNFVKISGYPIGLSLQITCKLTGAQVMILLIGDSVKFVYSTNIKGKKKILQGKINKILANDNVLIEVTGFGGYRGTLCNRNIADIIETSPVS